MSNPIEYTAKRYRCPHCRRSYAHAKTAATHMARCFRNPAVRSCKTCSNYGMDDLGPSCSLGLVDQLPTCSRCGADIDPRGGECPAEHGDRPLYGMRVHCEGWENDG